jgi:3-methyl-2-oxobutanoate hydroxymethyltransferase
MGTYATPRTSRDNTAALSAADIRSLKGVRRLAVLTAYDYPTALALDEAGLDMILVGDSLGEVELGYESTRWVTLQMMVHHVRAVRHGVTRTHLVADMPAGTYRDPAEALATAQALMDAGADSVKLEGALIPQVEAIVAAAIPVMGHVGLLPQTAGERRRHGKTAAEADAIAADAAALDAAGCYSIVIEAVVPDLATRITPAVGCPTIGIAAGSDCDGQVLVSTDLLGLLPDPPPFVKPAVDLRSIIQGVGRDFVAEVRNAG